MNNEIRWLLQCFYITRTHKTLILISSLASFIIWLKKFKLMSLVSVLCVLVLAFAVHADGASLNKKKPRVSKNKDVMTVEYEFDEPEIITEDNIDSVTIKGFERYSRAK